MPRSISPLTDLEKQGGPSFIIPGMEWDMWKLSGVKFWLQVRLSRVSTPCRRSHTDMSSSSSAHSWASRMPVCVWGGREGGNGKRLGWLD